MAEFWLTYSVTHIVYKNRTYEEHADVRINITILI
jgi:hypothetical protein